MSPCPYVMSPCPCDVPMSLCDVRMSLCDVPMSLCDVPMSVGLCDVSMSGRKAVESNLLNRFIDEVDAYIFKLLHLNFYALFNLTTWVTASLPSALLW